ncbi:hypothetical protein I3843_04G183100 [Carya illinoinensis]|uniref:Exopolygalacturonase-like n=1 Tax=Carya illinoinensis TaxID=32201 RepID=A0A8T1QXR0_CARIL|nr:exopolygalacturonase-like [Carya illinoinensis]KAG2713811.1 hypothetical protein I3760_04G193100 [Carya illinoinensis]KAG6658913.1 hypothetical protein CIPAW_04G194500 [Carya illinoinensis]KAG6719254.1 hypothetical protein I3842_04G192800 [Carya illinoinensis]KAG7984891.1 hypothetical protein I3843_04G183100 [Carya illinoinensis]
MGLKINVGTVALLLLLALYAANAQSGVFDITKYGGKSNGDITQAVTKAWQGACQTAGKSKVVIPKGTYRMGAVQFNGPCKGRIEFQIQGTVQAPGDRSYFKSGSWVNFQRINGFTLSGGGTFDGKGSSVWGKRSCSGIKYCGDLPISLRFDFISNGLIQGITSLDSKQFHINLLGCKNVTFQHVNIIAPRTSPNTDGIHIGRSSGIRIIDTKIATGDDCVSIGDGSRDILVQRVTCGPGHGISVGSLGKYSNEEPVVGVKVVDCTLTNTQNGVRIKTWPNSYSGTASNIHFENLLMKNVDRPIYVNQAYCPWNQCKAQSPSKVKISDVTFKNIKGTANTREAVTLVCSKAVPCQKVLLSDIDIQYHGKDGRPTFQCTNIKPMLSGKQNPSPCTVK